MWLCSAWITAPGSVEAGSHLRCNHKQKRKRKHKMKLTCKLVRRRHERLVFVLALSRFTQATQRLKDKHSHFLVLMLASLRRRVVRVNRDSASTRFKLDLIRHLGKRLGLRLHIFPSLRLRWTCERRLPCICICVCILRRPCELGLSLKRAKQRYMHKIKEPFSRNTFH